MQRGERKVQRKRTASAVLFVLLSTLLLVPGLHSEPADAPLVDGDAPGAAYALAEAQRLFGRFREDDGGFRGTLMEFTPDAQDEALRDIRYDGTTLIERLGPVPAGASPEREGPVVAFRNGTHHVAVHDNRYAWIRYGAETPEIHLRFPPGAEIEVVPEGVTARTANLTVRLQYTRESQSNVSVDDSSVRIRPRSGTLNFTIALDTGIHGSSIRPGSWWLVAHADGTTVADVLRPTGQDHRLEPDGDLLRLHLARLSTMDDRDAAHRIETIGFFPQPPHLIVRDPDEGPFHPRNGTIVFEGTETLRASNVSHAGEITRILLRQPYDHAGAVEIQHDGVPPRLIQVRLHNLTERWQPETQPLQMVLQADEPVTARLDLTSISDTHTLTRTRATTSMILPLDQLDAETTYDWRLTVTDLAGNTNTTAGAFATPPDPTGLVPLVQIHRPEDGAHLSAVEPVFLEATITDGAGGALPPDKVTIELDGRAIEDGVTWDRHRLRISLGLVEDGPHEIRITALGYDEGRVGADVARFHVGSAAQVPTGAPAALALMLFMMLHLARRR